MFRRSCGEYRPGDGMVSFMVFAALLFFGFIGSLRFMDSLATNDAAMEAREVARQHPAPRQPHTEHGRAIGVNPCPDDEDLSFLTGDGYFECTRGTVPIAAFDVDVGDAVGAHLELEVLAPHTAGRLRCTVGTRPVLVGREVTCVIDCDSVLLKIAAELMR